LEAERRIEEARRTQAESLDLGDLALSELPANLGDLSHLKALHLGRNGLTGTRKSKWDSSRELPDFEDLSPLAGLQGLQSLDLDSCKCVTDLAPLAGLRGLQNLNLWSTGVLDLSALAELQELQRLDLSETKVTDLSPLAGLRKLQSLSLSGTSDELQKLQGLDLLETKVTDLLPLAGLQELQSLNLAGTAVSNLSQLANLQELQSLDLSETKVTDLLPLAGLQKLQSLNLSGTAVSDLSPLAGLQGLQRLDLIMCHSVEDLLPLAGLEELQSLDLSYIGLSDLSPLAGLKELQNLVLAFTGVTDLSPLTQLEELQSLDLTDTAVTNLSPLAGLEKLQSLDLSSCTGLTDLSSLAGLQRLHRLNLYRSRPGVPSTLLRIFADHPHLIEFFADEAIGIPREVLSHGYDNCLPRLRTYFSELDLGAETENEVKVILLGNGRVGKTQLCRRFRGQSFDESVGSTHGIQIWREELRIDSEGKEQVFQVNWWDFGGQDIYHGTHALFLRSRSVFLILWTPQLENRNEYAEGSITLRNQPLTYWLDYVRSLAGEGSPVIVVQSQCDRFADRLPAPVRPGEFVFFESCCFSAKEDLGRETLEAQFRDAIRYLLERNGALVIGHSRAEVRRRLYEWRSEDQKRKPEKRQHRTLTLEEFRGACDRVGGLVSWEYALDYFHHTGVVFYRPDLFSNRIVLDQDWALDAIYTVFHRGRTLPWLRDSGRFTQEDLAATVWQEHSLEEQKLFLGLMTSCGVCFRCGATTLGEVRYVAPDLLPRFEAIAGRLHAWKDEAGTPTLRLEFHFFHYAVIRALMSEIGRRAGELAEYWKYGLWLKDGQRDTQLLLQFVDTSTDNVSGAGALEVMAQGRAPLGLLREIRKAVLQRQIGEKPEEFLTLESVTVARSALTTLSEGRVLDSRKTWVPAVSFSAFFEGREHEPDAGAEGGKTSGSTSILCPSPLATSLGARCSSPMPGETTLRKERSARRPSTVSTELSRRTAFFPSATAFTCGPGSGSPPSSANSPAPIS
jgi:internalin A